MRLVTFRPMASGDVGAPDHRTPDYRVAVVLDTGHIVPLSALAQLTPSLDANFGRMELTGIIARDPGFLRIREALALTNPGVLDALPSHLRTSGSRPRFRGRARRSAWATTTSITSRSRAWSGRFGRSSSRCSPAP